MEKYEEKLCIGRGNYGSAYLAHKVGSEHEQFVVKKISIELLSEGEKELAHGEVDCLSTLVHPHIVEYHESFLQNDTLHIIMSYCEGGDLSKRIKARAKANQLFSQHQILDWFVQIASALRFVHSKRILHRDLKTNNIFLTADHFVKLGDFGIARVLDSTLDQAKTVVGTPYYMSPEVCESKPYSYASDIWALGCVLYEMCALKHAFTASNLLGLVFKIVQHEPLPIPDLYSDELGQLIRQMLRKAPEQRPTIDQIFQCPLIQKHPRVYCPSSPIAVSCMMPPPAPSIEGVRPPEPSTSPTRIPSSSRPSFSFQHDKEIESLQKTIELDLSILDDQDASLTTEQEDEEEQDTSTSQCEVEENYYSDDFESDFDEEDEILEYSAGEDTAFERTVVNTARRNAISPDISSNENRFRPRRRPSIVDRMNAIRSYLDKQLGTVLFEQVYQFLRQMHREGKTNCKSELVGIVGRARLHLCFEVDQLIHFEDMIHKSNAAE